MNRVKQYIIRIYASRYFWWNLTLADLRFKYRRSYFGILWSIFQPLALTVLLSFVMGRFFHVPMRRMAPYIFSGMVVWDLVIGSSMAGCTALLNSGSYIQLFNHPMAIYTIRSTLSVFINFLYAMIGVLAWSMLALPENFGWSYCSVVPAALILFVWCWSGATVCAFAGVRFRDLPQFLVIILQMIWYMSPVFFPLDFFQSAKLDWLLKINPVYHLLELFRSPLLDGVFPAWEHFAWSLCTAFVLWIFAVVFICCFERKTIYYV